MVRLGLFSGFCGWFRVSAALERGGGFWELRARALCLIEGSFAGLLR